MASSVSFARKVLHLVILFTQSRRTFGGIASSAHPCEEGWRAGGGVWAGVGSSLLVDTRRSTRRWGRRQSAHLNAPVRVPKGCAKIMRCGGRGVVTRVTDEHDVDKKGQNQRKEHAQHLRGRTDATRTDEWQAEPGEGVQGRGVACGQRRTP